MLNVSFIEATEDMCLELAHVKKQVWLTTYKGIYPNSKIEDFDYSKHAEKFKTYINSQDLELYVAVLDNKIIGYTAVGFSPHRQNSKEIEIVLLYLLKEFQGLGIGRKLFSFAKDKIKEKGYDSFIVSCNKYNSPAQAFYKKMGGEVIKIDEDNEDKSLPQVTFIYKN